MAELIKDMWAGMPWYLYVILLLSIGLLIASFIVPPLGTISPSVLQGIAIILGGTWLLYTTANIPVFVATGAKIRATYGNASIEIGRNRRKKQDETIRPEKQLQEEETENYD